MANFTFYPSCASYYTYTLYYSATDCTTACNSGTPGTYYSTSSPIAIGSIIIGSDGQTITEGYYSDNTNCYSNFYNFSETPIVTSTTLCTPPCECHDGTINDNGSFSYYDCNGVFFTGGAELGSEICYNIYAFHSSNITDNGISGICFC